MPPSDPSPPKLTDLEILEAIYNRVYGEFVAKRAGETNFMPVDLEAVASGLGMDRDMLFGRLYFDLDKRYAHEREDGPNMRLFSPVVGDEQNCMNVPHLGSVVADLTEKQKKYNWSVRISIVSALIAFLSLGISAAALFSGGA